MDQRFEFAGTAHSRVVVGDGVEARLPELIAELQPDGVVVVYDGGVSAVAERIADALSATAVVPVDPRPPIKTLAAVADLAERLHAANATRATALVAVGGGTLADLAGFTASMYLRGIPFVVCPTTTLAMCDAALGGKNGVDFQGLKNRLGTIRQPELVVADVAWLRALPQTLFCEGLVEVVKKAAVLDATAFAALERTAHALVDRDPGATLAAVRMAVTMKMAVVLADEREQDHRRALNFGHTIGHALESLAAGHQRHGMAVAMGLVAECRAANVADEITDRVVALLRTLGAPVAIPPELADGDRLWQLAQRDKKAMHGTVPMYVPAALGRGRIVELTRAGLARALA